MPYLLKLHVLWKRCSLRLFSVIVDPKDNPEQVMSCAVLASLQHFR